MGTQPSQNSKCQDLPKFQFGEGGVGTLSQVKTQSAKICLNFNFWGQGVTSQPFYGPLMSLNLATFGVGGLLLAKSKLKSVKICLNLQFWGGGCSLS